MMPRTVLAITSLVLSVHAIQRSSTNTKLQQSLHQVPDFDAYVAYFERDFVKGSDEYIARRSLYETRSHVILSTNRRAAAGWTAGVNQFTDRTQEELKAFHGWSRRSHHSGHPTVSLLEDHHKTLPETVDWTSGKSKLSALKVTDQDACGSCWAFATVNMLNAHYELQTGKVKDYSPQELVDCVDNPKNCGGTGGCDGATVELALAYVSNISLSKLRTRSQYKYLAKTGKCQAMSANEELAVVDRAVSMPSFQTLPVNSATSLMQALVQGPVAVSVGASNEWFWYDSGIFGDCSKDSVINHAVLMVGYGDGWWKIQNSWGSYWGEDGYMFVKRFGEKQDSAHCGIDNKPQDGVACEPYPDKVTVCGMCGILYDSVSVNMLRLDHSKF